MGPRDPVPYAEAGGWRDDVQAMTRFLAAHREVTWLRPVTADDKLDGSLPHKATWAEGGTTVTAERKNLGQLVDYLRERFGDA